MAAAEGLQYAVELFLGPVLTLVLLLPPLVEARAVLALAAVLLLLLVVLVVVVPLLPPLPLL